MVKRHIPELVMIFLLALLLGSCSSSQTSLAKNAPPTALQVTRNDLGPGYPSFSTHIVKNAAKVQQFYHTIFTLPKASLTSGTGCAKRILTPVYQINFLQGTASLLKVFVPVEACGIIVLNKQEVRWQTEGFWQQFSATVGVPESVLTPN